jgi:hypothetical protein
MKVVDAIDLWHSLAVAIQIDHFEHVAAQRIKIQTSQSKIGQIGFES